MLFRSQKGVSGAGEPMLKCCAVLWYLRNITLDLTNVLEARMTRYFTDPLGYLANACETRCVMVKPFNSAEPGPVLVSTQSARASAACFLKQIKLLIHHYDSLEKRLNDYIDGPLKIVLENWPDCEKELKAFIVWDINFKQELERLGDILETEKVVDPFCKPLNAFPKIHHAAMLAAATRVDNVPIERAWSTLSGIEDMCPTASDHYFSNFIKRSNATQDPLLTQSDKFLAAFTQSRELYWRNKKLFKTLHDKDLETSEARIQQRQLNNLPAYVKQEIGRAHV